MARLRAAVSVRQWWTIETFTRKPVIADVPDGGRFALRKSSNYDSALQQMPDVGATDGVANYRLRPTLWGRIEDLPSGGSRLSGEFVDGVRPGKPTYILTALIGLACLGAVVYQYGITANVLFVVLFFAVLAPVLDGLFRVVRWLYMPDREILCRFLDRLYRDVQVSPAQPEPARSERQRQPRAALRTASEQRTSH